MRVVNKGAATALSQMGHFMWACSLVDLQRLVSKAFIEMENDKCFDAVKKCKCSI